MLLIVLHTALVIVSLFFLIKGSEWLLKGSVALAENLKISKLAIASTLIAFGTGLPTIAVNLALISVGGDSLNAIAGNAIGTNYVNIGLALGIPAFLVTIVAKYEVFEKEIPLFFAVTAILTAFSMDSTISTLEGITLLIIYVVVLIVIYQFSLRDKVHPEYLEEVHVDTSTISKIETKNLSFSLTILNIVTGLIVLIISSIILARLTPIIASDWNVSEYVLGLTVVGIGTSLPTIVTSLRAAKKGYIDIVLGNVFGGSIANIALGFGLAAVIQELKLNSEAISDTYSFTMFSIVVLFLTLIEMRLLGNNKTLSKISGIIMISIYVIYLLSKFV